MTMNTCRCLFKPTKKCYEERFGDTKEACGIVAGAAALVLERFPRYSPEKVKQYLVSEATDGVINMYQLLPRIRAKTPNKLLYIGNDGCKGKLNFTMLVVIVFFNVYENTMFFLHTDKQYPFSGSGDYYNDDEDSWKKTF